MATVATAGMVGIDIVTGWSGQDLDRMWITGVWGLNKPAVTVSTRGLP
jgi:hypothetical protein